MVAHKTRTVKSSSMVKDERKVVTEITGDQVVLGVLAIRLVLLPGL